MPIFALLEEVEPKMPKVPDYRTYLAADTSGYVGLSSRNRPPRSAVRAPACLMLHNRDRANAMGAYLFEDVRV